MLLLGTGVSPPCGTVQVSLWKPKIGTDSIWGKEFWIFPTDPTDQAQLSQAIVFDMLTKIEQKTSSPLSENLKFFLNVFVKEGISFWWNIDMLDKADLAWGPYLITFKNIKSDHKKEVHVHHKEMLLLDMYTYYAQPYIDQEDEQDSQTYLE